MDCDRCGAYVSNTFRVFDVDGNEEWVCVQCKHGAELRARGGKIAQDPADEARS